MTISVKQHCKKLKQNYCHVIQIGNGESSMVCLQKPLVMFVVIIHSRKFPGLIPCLHYITDLSQSIWIQQTCYKSAPYPHSQTFTPSTTGAQWQQCVPSTRAIAAYHQSSFNNTLQTVTSLPGRTRAAGMREHHGN